MIHAIVQYLNLCVTPPSTRERAVCAEGGSGVVAFTLTSLGDRFLVFNHAASSTDPGVKRLPIMGTCSIRDHVCLSRLILFARAGTCPQLQTYLNEAHEPMVLLNTLFPLSTNANQALANNSPAGRFHQIDGVVLTKFDTIDTKVLVTWR